MWRYFAGGFGALVPVSAAIQIFAGCNQPEETQYGNPNTLDRKNLPGGDASAAAPSCTTSKTFDGGCPSFAADIYPYLLDKGKWKCSAAVCHGGSQAPVILSDNASSSLEGLRKATVAGKPYIPTGDAGADVRTTTSILCNLQGTCGSKMPRAPGIELTPDELCIVDSWVGCGSPP